MLRRLFNLLRALVRYGGGPSVELLVKEVRDRAPDSQDHSSPEQQDAHAPEEGVRPVQLDEELEDKVLDLYDPEIYDTFGEAAPEELEVHEKESKSEDDEDETPKRKKKVDDDELV